MEIKISDLKIEIKGHANPKFEDAVVVCASISGLTESYRLQFPNNHMRNEVEEKTTLFFSNDGKECYNMIRLFLEEIQNSENDFKKHIKFI